MRGLINPNFEFLFPSSTLGPFPSSVQISFPSLFQSKPIDNYLSPLLALFFDSLVYSNFYSFPFLSLPAFVSFVPCNFTQNPTHKNMADFQFKKGTKVEISIDEEGFRGAWFSGTVIKPPTKNGKVLVEYDTLLADESDTTPLREEVDVVQIRPTPPRESSRVFNLDEEVDAYHNDGWWEGVITQVLQNGEYSVYFRPNREQSDFKGSDLRLHREWVHGKWVPPLQEEVVQLTAGKNAHQHKEEKLFNPGSLVEVSSDEDGFEGAWFAATIVEVIEGNKYLIEYKDLRTEDDTEFVREEVDELHIRPCPPPAGKIDRFKLYEEVDALYNDGWWVGIISKVHRSKYAVYFKGTNEELKFKHGDLRLHQDWIGGKWVMASQSLDLSH